MAAAPPRAASRSVAAGPGKVLKCVFYSIDYGINAVCRNTVHLLANNVPKQFPFATQDDADEDATPAQVTAYNDMVKQLDDPHNTIAVHMLNMKHTPFASRLPPIGLNFISNMVSKYDVTELTNGIVTDFSGFKRPFDLFGKAPSIYECFQKIEVSDLAEGGHEDLQEVLYPYVIVNSSDPDPESLGVAEANFSDTYYRRSSYVLKRVRSERNLVYGPLSLSSPALDDLELDWSEPQRTTFKAAHDKVSTGPLEPSSVVLPDKIDLWRSGTSLFGFGDIVYAAHNSFFKDEAIANVFFSGYGIMPNEVPEKEHNVIDCNARVPTSMFCSLNKLVTAHVTLSQHTLNRSLMDSGEVALPDLLPARAVKALVRHYPGVSAFKSAWDTGALRKLNIPLSIQTKRNVGRDDLADFKYSTQNAHPIVKLPNGIEPYVFSIHSFPWAVASMNMSATGEVPPLLLSMHCAYANQVEVLVYVYNTDARKGMFAGTVNPEHHLGLGLGQTTRELAEQLKAALYRTHGYKDRNAVLGGVKRVISVKVGFARRESATLKGHIVGGTSVPAAEAVQSIVNDGGGLAEPDDTTILSLAQTEDSPALYRGKHNNGICRFIARIDVTASDYGNIRKFNPKSAWQLAVKEPVF